MRKTGEDIAARVEERSFSRGRNGVAADKIFHIFEIGLQIGVVEINRNVDFVRFSRHHIHYIQVTAVFVRQFSVSARWPHYIEI